MPEAPENKSETPQETSNRIARTFFGAGGDEASNRAAIRQSLAGAILSILLVPALFYLRFGEVGPLGWGLAVFCTVYCLLAAVGLYFRNKPEYHSPVPLRGDWADRIGAFWLVACAFGPLFGWALTALALITPRTWQWLYAARLFLAAGLPVLTALPLTRYARGKSAWIALLILLTVTLLAASSAYNISRDLLSGPILKTDPASGQILLYLQYTARSLGIAP